MTPELMKYTINAKGKRIGRVASEAARYLMGKNDPSFVRHSAPQAEVEVTNASLLSIQPGKREGKEYIRHTGYPSGLRRERMAHLIERKGYEEVVRKAVYGMLPANKLRSKMMKRLIVKS